MRRLYLILLLRFTGRSMHSTSRVYLDHITTFPQGCNIPFVSLSDTTSPMGPIELSQNPLQVRPWLDDVGLHHHEIALLFGVTLAQTSLRPYDLLDKYCEREESPFTTQPVSLHSRRVVGVKRLCPKRKHSSSVVSPGFNSPRRPHTVDTASGTKG